MIRFSANLSTLFGEVDFLDRFGLAARAGFKAVECTFPYGWDKGRLAEQLASHGLKQVLHNLPPGDWKSGDRGMACVPGREGEFQESVGVALEYAKALNCPRLNCLAGMRPPDVAPDKAMVTLIENLRFAASALEKGGILAGPPGDFYVKGRRGPLLDGELERAAQWAAELAIPE